MKRPDLPLQGYVQGEALIYDSEESASLEPKFIVDRHEKTRAQKETGGDE